jgi:putative SOS response-associated peptidase YedK
LSKIITSFKDVVGTFKFGLLTAYDPYSKGNRDRGEYMKKMKEISDAVHFMEDYNIAPHNRYIVVQTSKETRWWSLPDGLVSGMSRVKSATKLEPGRGIEESVSNFINSVGKKKEESQ